mmetsp:Transcript_50038/g.74700  ORF Transcript_50038/g.74700 Transcript_50038/m.74700 type:complete len:158 (+) Transcript_50038:38-511(+)
MKTTASDDGDEKHTSLEDEEAQLPPNRFEIELEFVQSLASPAYLHYLATTGVLYESSFLKMLEYLQYWKRPEYIRFLNFPHALYFLDLIVHSAMFRKELGTVAFRNFVHEQQFFSWQNRARTLYGQGLPKEDQEGKDTDNGGGDDNVSDIEVDGDGP